MTESPRLRDPDRRAVSRPHAARHRAPGPQAREPLHRRANGRLKILDFGLARRTPHASDVGSEITREGSVLGTVQYMSPEQAAARPLDHRSDQFSFGAILYEMATGRRAFARDTAPQTLAAIIEDEPEPMKRLHAEIPVRLSAIVRRCLAKDKEKRYDSMAELVKQLELASSSAVPALLRRPTRWP